MGCKPSTLGPHARDSSNAGANAAHAVASLPTDAAAGRAENDSFAAAAAVEHAAEIPVGAAPAGDSSCTNSCSASKGPGLRLRLASLKPDFKNFSSPRASLASGYDKLKRGASSLKAAMTPRTATPGASPRDAEALEAPGGPHFIASDAIKEADNAACLDVAETKSQAVSGHLHTVVEAAAAGDRKAEETSNHRDTKELHTELINKDSPSPQQLKALWILMKINAAASPQQTMQWLHDLEVLLVTLDPVERQQPTRSILLEAKALEICLRPLSQSPEEVQLCVSSLAVIVHLCMAKEASERLLELGGIDITARVLKKYFSKAKRLLRDIPQMHVVPEEAAAAAADDQQQQHQQHEGLQRWEDIPEPPTPAPTPAGVSGTNSNFQGGPTTPQQQPILKGAAAVAEAVDSSHKEANQSADAAEDTPTPQEQSTSSPAVANPTATAEAAEAAEAAAAVDDTQPAGVASPPAAANASPEPSTKPQSNGQIAAFRRACSKLQQQLQQKLGTSTDTTQVTQEQLDSAMRELKLLVEFMTLVWRLVFATSLDGDEFAQRWASLGVPELAIEALGSSEAVFKENGFVCWGLGSLRFIPLAVPSVAETYVHSKMLLPVAFDRMELHHTDPLVLENGLAVLANYQRKQPANSQLFSKQRPDAWAKCVSWLLEEESLSRVDVLFQGLFALGLACSYCPLAAKRVREAGGLLLTDKVLEDNSQLPRQPSNSSTVDSKLATLQQFAEGLRLLLLRSEQAEAAESAAATKEEAAAAAAVPVDAKKTTSAAPAADGPADVTAPAAAPASRDEDKAPAAEESNKEASSSAAADIQAADDQQAEATKEFVLKAEEESRKLCKKAEEEKKEEEETAAAPHPGDIPKETEDTEAQATDSQIKDNAAEEQPNKPSTTEQNDQ